MFAWLRSHECYFRHDPCLVSEFASFYSMSSFSSLLIKFRGKKGWQAAGVLCYKSLREFNFINMKELRKHTHHFLLFQGDTAAVSGSWTCRKAGGGHESHKLLVCGQRILRAGTLMHYVGEEQVNISWAAVTPTAYMHPCMHTYTQWKHR